MSVAVASGEKCLLVTKGAAEEMLSVCAFAEWQGGVVPLTPALRAEILARIGVLNRQGCACWPSHRRASHPIIRSARRMRRR